nr:N-acetyltransferase 9-like protein isoform X1 [Onthophagus taurus]
MLINRNTKIIGSKVILIPYKKEHVEKYHRWMQSPELLRLTGSEPLSLQQEYEMQNSWMVDANKCTFIVLDKEKYQHTRDEIESMIGDTNLYFMDTETTLAAEAEIMIAEEWARGKHCGIEAMAIMLWYGIEQLDVKHFLVRILDDNVASIKLFEKLGFIQTVRSEAFKEVTMEKVVDLVFIEFLKVVFGSVAVTVYKSDDGDDRIEIGEPSPLKIPYVDE